MPVYTLPTDAIVFGNKFAYVDGQWILWAGPWYADLRRRMEDYHTPAIVIHTAYPTLTHYTVESDTTITPYEPIALDQQVTWHRVNIAAGHDPHIMNTMLGFVCANGQFLPTGLWGATRPHVPIETPPPMLPPNPEATGREPTITSRNGEPHVYTDGISGSGDLTR